MTLEGIKKLHAKVGALPANKLTPTMIRWHTATTKYIARKERELGCPQKQETPRQAEASGIA